MTFDKHFCKRMRCQDLELFDGVESCGAVCDSNNECTHNTEGTLDCEKYMKINWKSDRCAYHLERLVE